jgi:hypothetical protein
MILFEFFFVDLLSDSFEFGRLLSASFEFGKLLSLSTDVVTRETFSDSLVALNSAVVLEAVESNADSAIPSKARYIIILLNILSFLSF